MTALERRRTRDRARARVRRETDAAWVANRLVAKQRLYATNAAYRQRCLEKQRERDLQKRLKRYITDPVFSKKVHDCIRYQYGPHQLYTVLVRRFLTESGRMNNDRPS